MGDNYNKETLLRNVGLKTMFHITDEEMPLLVEEYDVYNIDGTKQYV